MKIPGNYCDCFIEYQEQTRTWRIFNDLLDIEVEQAIVTCKGKPRDGARVLAVVSVYGLSLERAYFDPARVNKLVPGYLPRFATRNPHMWQLLPNGQVQAWNQK